METFGNFFTPKNADFFCKFCEFTCRKNSDWLRHISTRKHLSRHNGNFFTPKNADYACDCGKLYNTKSGLWKHQKTCKNENNAKESLPTDKELMLMILKDNSELKNIILEVVKNGIQNTTNNTITTHTNSHNKAFNLNFFLNETCKDAMNITDFVESIKLQLSDLENVGKLGYVEGISNIIVKNLKELDITKRPVHCTDKKRETTYIKDENKWEKDEQNVKLHKFVRKVAFKNQKLLPKFKEEHPDCLQYHSKYSDQYNKIVYESMGGKGDNDYEKEEKIIKNVLKEVVVDKNI
jgi:hypothetical protein